MAEESGVGVRRRGGQEIARLAALYRKSGIGRSEFCRSHGMALSTLARHLKKQSGEQRLSENAMAGESRLRIPVRDSLNEILPGLANRSVQQVADLTPAAWAARHNPTHLYTRGLTESTVCLTVRIR